MGKKKPLTTAEKFLYEHMGGKIYRTEMDDKGNYQWKAHERTPTEFRRLLKGRREAVCPYGEKYLNMHKAFHELREAIAGKDFKRLQTAIWGMERAMKFQGYNQLELVFLENLMTGKAKEEIEHLTRSMKLQRKVKAISG